MLGDDPNCPLCMKIGAIRFSSNKSVAVCESCCESLCEAHVKDCSSSDETPPSSLEDGQGVQMKRGRDAHVRVAFIHRAGETCGMRAARAIHTT